ncbi:MAG: protein arginine phosphatase [Acidimicrobiaceae bacterium]
MAGAALAARLPGILVETAGTLTIDGQPMSWRTRTALESVGLAFPSHRSRQASHTDIDKATLIVGLAPEHVLWVRRNHITAAGRTATLKRLCRDLSAGEAPLADRVAALGLADVELEDWEEVVDPGGGEVEVFVECAHEVFGLVQEFAGKLH